MSKNCSRKNSIMNNMVKKPLFCRINLPILFEIFVKPLRMCSLKKIKIKNRTRNKLENRTTRCCSVKLLMGMSYRHKPLLLIIYVIQTIQ